MGQYVKGYLDIVGGGSVDNTLPGGGGIDNTLPPIQGPVDPGYGYPLPPVVDNGLPNQPGVWPPQKPTYPVYPNHDLPTRPGLWPNPPAPPGVWPPTPPLRPSHPIYPTRPTDPGYGVGIERPDQGLPPSGERPDQGLPPGPDQGLPGGEHPDQGLPGRPPRPSRPIHPGGGRPTDPDYGVDSGHRPDQGLPLPPGSVWPPLPPSVTGTIIAFCWIVGVGYRWVVIDPNLGLDNELPGERPPHVGGRPPGSGGGDRPPHAMNPIDPGGQPDQGLPPQEPDMPPAVPEAAPKRR